MSGPRYVFNLQTVQAALAVPGQPTPPAPFASIYVYEVSTYWFITIKSFLFNSITDFNGKLSYLIGQGTFYIHATARDASGKLISGDWTGRVNSNMPSNLAVVIKLR